MEIFPTIHSFQRLGNFPLDKTFHQADLSAVEEYINGAAYYEGQLLYILDARTQEEKDGGVELYSDIFFVDKERNLQGISNKKVEDALKEAEEKFDERMNGLSLKKLTQEEYDALTEEEKNDESIFYIISNEEELDLSVFATKEDLNSKANVSHEHVIEDITSLETLINDIYETMGNKAEADHTHDWSQIDLSSKADVVHNHVITDIENLETTIAGIESSIENKANKLHEHEEFLTLQQGILSKADREHEHAIDNITNLQNSLDLKADKEHEHSVADLTDFITEMDKKANARHNHQASEITDLTALLEERAEADHKHFTADILDFESKLNSHQFPITAVRDLSSILSNKADVGHTHNSGEFADMLDKYATLEYVDEEHQHNLASIDEINNTINGLF